MFQRLMASSHYDIQGTLKYLIKWEGYEKKKDRTWEPLEYLYVYSTAP